MLAAREAAEEILQARHHNSLWGWPVLNLRYVAWEELYNLAAGHHIAICIGHLPTIYRQACFLKSQSSREKRHPLSSGAVLNQTPGRYVWTWRAAGVKERQSATQFAGEEIVSCLRCYFRLSLGGCPSLNTGYSSVPPARYRHRISLL